jgi:hypothetical protein
MQADRGGTLVPCDGFHRLVGVRHAKSSSDDSDLADRDRPLAPRGKKAGASSIVGARYLALLVMSEYRYNSGNKVQTSRDFDAAGDQLDAVYATGRLAFPFEGVLLVGY